MFCFGGAPVPVRHQGGAAEDEEHFTGHVLKAVQNVPLEDYLLVRLKEPLWEPSKGQVLLLRLFSDAVRAESGGVEVGADQMTEFPLIARKEFFCPEQIYRESMKMLRNRKVRLCGCAPQDIVLTCAHCSVLI